MRRWMGLLVVGLGFVGAYSIVGSSGTPLVAEAEAAPSADAGAPQSVYLMKASSGSVLPPSVEDAEAFCALVLACKDVPMFPPAPDFQGCVHALMEQLSSPGALGTSVSIRECGLSATSCKTLRQCALKGASATICDNVAMESEKPIGKCDLDARAITCWRGKVLGVRNCGLADELCVVKEGKAECALPGACPSNVKAEWSCSGTRMVKCQDNKFVSIDCKVLNLGCVSAKDDKGNPVVGCAPSATATCKDTKIKCDGTNAVGCVYGKEVKVACGEAGMTCADPTKPPTDRTVGACEVPSGTKACDPKKFEPKCTGASIEYCANGVPRSYPCKSIGASKCVMDKTGGPRCT